LRKRDGALAWTSPPGEAPGSKGLLGFASPVMYSEGDTPHAVFFNLSGTYGVRAADGKAAWSFAWPPHSKPHAQYTADPLVWNRHVLVSAVYSRGTGLFRIGPGDPEEVWAHRWAFKSSSPVLLDGHLYAPVGNKVAGVLFCVDFLSGEVRWKRDIQTGISLIAVGRRLVVLSHRGDLRIVRADPSAYHELAVARLDPELSAADRVKHTGVWWTPPVYCRGRLYCRKDDGELVCVRAE
jgi:outer membrane protein assembly factor BamB